MKGFIEVPWPKEYGKEEPRLINVDHIVEVFTSLSNNYEKTCLLLSNDLTTEEPLGTDLSYAEVKQLIEDAQK